MTVTIVSSRVSSRIVACIPSVALGSSAEHGLSIRRASGAARQAGGRRTNVAVAPGEGEGALLQAILDFIPQTCPFKAFLGGRSQLEAFANAVPPGTVGDVVED